MKLIKMRRDDGMIADVHPDMVADYRKGGYVAIDDDIAPKIPLSKPAAMGDDSAPLGYDSGDQFSDAQLRDAIKEATGTAPGPATKRETLVAKFNEMNAERWQRSDA